MVFVEDAVRNLRQSLRDGNIEPGEGASGTEPAEAVLQPLTITSAGFWSSNASHSFKMLTSDLTLGL